MDKETQLSEAIEAALDKKAQDAVVLELAEICSFTSYFLICTGTSTRHNQTIADHIEETLKKIGVRPLHIDGHTEGEWVLLDYVDFVVLDAKGQAWTSDQFAGFVQKHMTSGPRRLTFVIGDYEGVPSEVKRRSD